MKKIIFIMTLVLALMISLYLLSPQFRLKLSAFNWKTPRVYPAQTKSIYGSTVDLNQGPDQWLVINYWAHWCDPCIKEIADLNQLQLQHRNQVRVIGINFDKLSNAEQRTFAQTYQIRYLLIAKNSIKQFKLPPPSVLPTTYLIAPNGKIEATLVGPHTLANLEKALGFSHALRPA